MYTTNLAKQVIIDLVPIPNPPLPLSRERAGKEVFEFWDRLLECKARPNGPSGTSRRVAGAISNMIFPRILEPLLITTTFGTD
jgi:hypothetical protein